ncbi:MAG: ATP-dependent RNA helicase dbp6 [Cirrosporium novae-zelandiae]|nr:MAG: ATP-dependent RNA helicase dbp6 [Cirrosporium novae-zelandiae]
MERQHEENTVSGGAATSDKRGMKRKHAPEGNPNEENFKYKNIRKKYERSAKLSKVLQDRQDAKSTITQDEGEEVENVAVKVQGLEPFPQPEPVVEEIAPPTYSTQLSWVAKPVTVSADSRKSFTELPISNKSKSILQSNDYHDALAVQAAVIPLLQKQDSTSGDLCIEAQTGSGKTLAYVLPLIEHLRKRVVTKLRGLIVVPNEELVPQIKEVCEMCASGSSLQIATAYGTKKFKEEQESLIKKSERYDPEEYRKDKRKPLLSDDYLDNGSYADLISRIENDLRILPKHAAIYSSKADILVCTPGHLVKHIRETEGFTLSDIQWLIVDEADKLLNESFQGWVDILIPLLESRQPCERVDTDRQILQAMKFPPERRRVRKIILSATMTEDISKLMSLRLNKPTLVSVKRELIVTDMDIDQLIINQKDSEQVFDLSDKLEEWRLPLPNGEESRKPLYLLQLLRQRLLSKSDPIASASDSEESESSSSDDSEDSESDSDTSTSTSSSSASASSHLSHRHDTSSHSKLRGILIFTKSNESANRLSHLLSILDPSLKSRLATLTKASSTHRTLSSFRSGKLSVLVATDRASRGLHIPNLAHVVNYDVPTSVETYVHRVGRTARAEKDGQAFTLTEHQQGKWFEEHIAKGEKIRRKGNRRVNLIKGLHVGEELDGPYRVALTKLEEAAKSGQNK